MRGGQIGQRRAVPHSPHTTTRVPIGAGASSSDELAVDAHLAGGDVLVDPVGGEPSRGELVAGGGRGGPLVFYAVMVRLGTDSSVHTDAARSGDDGHLHRSGCAGSCVALPSHMASPDDLAADLGVDERDVRVLLRQLGEQTPDMPDELAAFLRDLLDPHGERTAPPALYWPGSDDEPRRTFGLGGPDPTAP